jgi:hypothetical protein
MSRHVLHQVPGISRDICFLCTAAICLLVFHRGRKVIRVSLTCAQPDGVHCRLSLPGVISLKPAVWEETELSPLCTEACLGVLGGLIDVLWRFVVTGSTFCASQGLFLLGRGGTLTSCVRSRESSLRDVVCIFAPAGATRSPTALRKHQSS